MRKNINNKPPFKLITYLSMMLFLLTKETTSQNFKKLIISACIDLKTELHIKKGIAWWVWNAVAPGTDPNCPGKTKVNDKEWLESSIPFELGFSTDSCSATISLLQTNEISKLIQSPSGENAWETIWLFADPKSPGANRYSISLTFSSLKKIQYNTPNQKLKKTSPSINSDIIINQNNTNKNEQIVEPNYIFQNIKFEPGSSSLSIEAINKLNIIIKSIHTYNRIIQITKNKNMQLDRDRASTIYNYLIKKGLDSKKITFLEFGDNSSTNTKKIAEIKIIE